MASVHLRNFAKRFMPPYAAHTQVFFSLKINFRSFFFVYMRAMPSRRVAMLYLRMPPVYGHSYFTIVQRLPLHIPPKLLPPYAAHTHVFFCLKINFRSKHLCMCIFFCTFARFLQSKRNNVKNTLYNRRM